MKKLLLVLMAVPFACYSQFVNFVQAPNYSSFTPGGAQTGKFTANKNHLVYITDMSFQKTFMTKLNSVGDTIWAREMDGQGVRFFDYDELSDGSVIGLNNNQDSLFAYKINSNGTQGWAKKLLMPSNGQWSLLSVTASGTQMAYAVGSNYWSSGVHMLFGLMDSAGQGVVNTHIDLSSWFGANTYNIVPKAIQRTTTGDYDVMGYTYANSGIPEYVFFMQLNSVGQLNWIKVYQNGVGGSNTAMTLCSMNLTSNNEMLVTASKSSPQGTAFMRLDANGNVLWAKNIADNTYASQMVELNNGELALHMANSNQVSDAVFKNMMAILTPQGNIRVVRSFGFGQNNIVSTGCDAMGRITAGEIGGSYSAPVICMYNMDSLGNSTGCYDVINTLPVSSFTMNTSVSTASVSTIASLPSVNIAPPTFKAFQCVKTARNIVTNGVVTNPLCHGQLGGVNITPSLGVSPYNYSWSNGTNSQNLLNVPGGTYTIRIADASGCVGIDTFVVSEPSQLAATYTVSNVTCFGIHNGSINVTTSGGTPGYTWQWTTQDVTEDLSNLSGGFYQLTITDLNGCTKTVAVAVSEPQQLIAGILSSQNVKCHGACDGSLTGVASGGTSPYTYQWNNPGSATTTTVGGLCPGNYLFSVTDAHNCFTFANAVITEPAALSVSTSEAGSLCGGTTGMAVAQVTGGVSPYSYLWSNSTANDTAASLASGTYTVTATDANSCAVSSAVNVGLVTPTPDICMVTVDSLSTHNILIWDKTSFSNVAYFNIYREDITNNYTLIAAVTYDSLSEYHDFDTTMADPNVTTKRYKISAVDTCGNESAKSNFHNTIFIQHNNGTFTWNTYTIQNSPNPVTSYRLMRDDFATGNWQQIGTTAGTQNVLNDPNYSSFATTADWRVETVWGISCTSTMRQSNGAAAAVIKSKSNISNNRMIGIEESAASVFVMYPNPAVDVLMIGFEKASNAKIEVMNTLGAAVKTVNANTQQVSMSTNDLAAGVYYVRVSSENAQSIQRLVIQK